MADDRFVTAVVATACVLAIVVSATTFDSTVETDPAEEIDLDYDLLPLGESQGFELKQEMQSEGPGDETGGETTPERQEQDGDDEQQDSQRQQDDEQQQPDDDEQQPDSQESTQSSDDGGNDGASGEEESNTDEPTLGNQDTGTPTPLDRLLSLLERLLPLLAVAAVLAVVAVAVRRHRDRLGPLVAAFLPELERPSRDEPDVRREPSPDDEVQRAWLTLLSHAGVDHPWARTPRECAAAAVEDGYDPEPVDELRRLFEEVRYGGHEPTDDRVRRAREHLGRLGIERVEGDPR